MGGSAPQVVSVAQFTSITAGGESSCALDTSGRAYCWGSNQYEQLGQGTSDVLPHPAPERVPVSVTFQKLETSSGMTCGQTTARKLYCWYSIRLALIGHLIEDIRFGPAQMDNREYVSFGVRGSTVCAISMQQEVYCAGNNMRGALGSFSLHYESGRQEVHGWFVQGFRRITPVAGN